MTTANTTQQLLAELTVLQATGQHLRDPVGFVYLTQLAQRLIVQPEPVRRLLADKLASALWRYQEKLTQSQPQSQSPQLSRPAVKPQTNARSSTESVTATASVTTLAALNSYIKSSTHALDGAVWPPDKPGCSEMKSVRQFKQVWSHIQAEDQVAQALLLGPKNPGPINSHTLLLHTLTLMQQLSPAYLQHFWVQANTLLCLNQATATPLLAVSKARSRARLKK